MIPTKICNRCKQDKPLTEYSKDSATSSGFRTRCKACISSIKAAEREVTKARNMATAFDPKPKVCGHCRELKAPGDFDRDIGHSTGLQTICRQCRMELRSPEWARTKAIMGSLDSSREKFCRRCDTVKLLSDFYRCSDSPDGLYSMCKVCQKASNQDSMAKLEPKELRERMRQTSERWRSNNPDRYRDKYQEHMRNNREKYRAACRRWYQQNPEKAQAATARWRAENYEKMRASARKWQAENPERVKAIWNSNRAKRRLNIEEATPAWADFSAIRRIYQEAARLTAETGVRHSVDHIVPLRSKRVCGLHWEGNMQVMTHADNSSKQNRWWPDM